MHETSLGNVSRRKVETRSAEQGDRLEPGLQTQPSTLTLSLVGRAVLCPPCLPCPERRSSNRRSPPPERLSTLNHQPCLMEQLERTDVRCYEAQGVLRPRRRVASERGIHSAGWRLPPPRRGATSIAVGANPRDRVPNNSSTPGGGESVPLSPGAQNLIRQICKEQRAE
jgi:hypothetical protein